MAKFHFYSQKIPNLKRTCVVLITDINSHINNNNETTYFPILQCEMVHHKLEGLFKFKSIPSRLESL
jgi:hypothetical protein